MNVIVNNGSILIPFEGLTLIENSNLTVDNSEGFLSDRTNLSDPLTGIQSSLELAIATDSREKSTTIAALESVNDERGAIAFYPQGTIHPEGMTAQTIYSGTIPINLNAFRWDSRFQNIDGRGLAVVIIDTGIDLDHSFFGPDSDNNGIADRIVYQYDFAEGDTNASDISFYSGHGSHISSIIASQDSQYPGVAPKVNIIHLKIFKDDGFNNSSYLDQALSWVVNNISTYNIVAVNLSLGENANYSTPYQRYGTADKMATLAKNQVAVVSASGNQFYSFNSVQGVSYPAADPNGIAVGSVYAEAYTSQDAYGDGAVAYTTGSDRLAPYSQRHTNLTTIFAPGAIIAGADWKGGVVNMSGTSAATPYVTGAVVLAQQLALQTLGRRLSVTELSNLLKTTGTTINDGDDEDDNVTNTGANFKRLDMYALGVAIANMANPTLATPTVSISPPSITQNEGQSGTVTYTFTVSLTQASSQTVTVKYTTNDGTATVAENDYTDNDGTLIFNPGTLTQNIIVYAKGDTAVEKDETFSVKVTEVTNANLNTSASTATGTIVNDDVYPVVSLTNLQVTKNEGNSGTVAYSFTVSLSQTTGQMIAVIYATNDGTATVAGNDYTDNDGTLIFMPWTQTSSVTVYVKGDTMVEKDETFNLVLTGATNAVINTASSQATGTIVNDDQPAAMPTVSLSPTNVSQKEGDNGTTAYTFTVSLTQPPTQTVTVNYTTNDGTATVAGNDYTDNDGTLTFNPGGSLTQQITVHAKGDIVPENNEAFTVNLTGATNALVHSLAYRSTATLVNDDVYPVVSLSSALSSQNEGNSGTTNYNYSISLNGVRNYPVSVRYYTDNGTATTTDKDYTDNDGILTFNPGELTKSVTVGVNGDSKVENDETFSFRIAKPTNATLSTTQNKIVSTIINDDLNAASTSVAQLGTLYNTAIVGSMGGGSSTFTDLLPYSNDLVSFSGAMDHSFIG